MNYFTKKLYTYAGDSEFIFNRLAKADAAKYHVSVRNGGDKALAFTMEEKDNAWRIINTSQVPDWIRQEEMVLSEEILQRAC